MFDVHIQDFCKDNEGSTVVSLKPGLRILVVKFQLDNTTFFIKAGATRVQQNIIAPFMYNKWDGFYETAIKIKSGYKTIIALL